jgi:hypothetical protein
MIVGSKTKPNCPSADSWAFKGPANCVSPRNKMITIHYYCTAIVYIKKANRRGT